MRFAFFILILCLFFAPSCKKDPVIEEAPDLGYDYFPVSVGKYIVYDIDSTYYRELQNDTIHKAYRVKEVLDSTFNDNQGRLTYRMSRYYKMYDAQTPYDSIQWTIKDVWSVTITATTAETFEENYRYIRLIFPVDKNKTWNGNAQNNLGEWNYKYTNVDGTFSYNNVSYPETITITQKNETTALGKTAYEEKYAKNVGLVSKTIYDYKFKIINGVIQPGVIAEGLIYKQNIIEYHL